MFQTAVVAFLVEGQTRGEPPPTLVLNCKCGQQIEKPQAVFQLAR